MNRSVTSGFLTGQIAGLIMAVVVMIVFTLFLGHGPLYPVQVIGSFIYGEAALQGTNVSAIVAGLILHQLGPSLLWGIVFGVIAKALGVQSVKQALILGLAVGIVSMVDVYVFIPASMKALHGVDIWNREVPLFWDWAAHLVFGLSFGLFPLIAKKLERA